MHHRSRSSRPKKASSPTRDSYLVTCPAAPSDRVPLRKGYAISGGVCSAAKSMCARPAGVRLQVSVLAGAVNKTTVIPLAYVFRVEHWHSSLGCSILLCMPLEEGPDDRPTHTQARKARPVRWGYLQQAVARHGVVTSRLVVYPPGTSDSARMWAYRFYGFAPIALGGGTLCWLFLIALGVSPETSAVALACLISPAGVYLWQRARPVRGRTISIWSNRLGLWPHADDERREEMLTRFASAMQTACDDMQRGLITRDAFERIWASVYTDAILADGRTGRRHRLDHGNGR